MAEIICLICKKEIKLDKENNYNQKYICCDFCGYASIKNPYYKGD